MALTNNSLTTAQKFNLHALVVCLLVQISNVANLKSLEEYASQIVEARRQEAPHLLPEFMVHYPSNSEGAGKVPHLLIDQVSNEMCLIMLKLEAELATKNFMINLSSHILALKK